jgi:glycine/D-amino acid oxidase-like deaminating enzyme
MGEPSLWQLRGERTSFPTAKADIAADVVVVGAGVTGCACARRLAREGVSVAVIDGREVAAGASGRNGAFASTGTGLAFDRLVERVGLEPAVAVQELTESAMDEMLALAQSAGAPGAVRRTGSVWLAAPDEVETVESAIAALTSAGFRCRIDRTAVPERMRPWYPLAAVVDADGALLPAEWVRTLAAAAATAGAAIYEHTPATALTADGDGWVVTLAGGPTARGSAVVIASDGLMPALVPDLERVVHPVRGQVLATEPLDDTVITRPTHSDHGFLYYRPTPDSRVTLGGGRLADIDAEYTTVEQTSMPVQAALEEFLSERLGIDAHRITHRWAGIMGFSADMLPVVGEIPQKPGLWVCGGYSGVGNVPGFALGQLVADRIVGAPPTLVSRALNVTRFVGE